MRITATGEGGSAQTSEKKVSRSGPDFANPNPLDYVSARLRFAADAYAALIAPNLRLHLLVVI